MSDFWIFIFTKIISEESFFVIILLIAGDLFRRKQQRESLLLIVCAVSTGILVTILKELFAVSRPVAASIQLDSYAFPSAHATGAMFISVVVWWYVTKFFQLPRWVTAVGLFLFALIVGYSRLYLGVHTEWQVAAGYLIGVATGLVFLYFAKKP